MIAAFTVFFALAVVRCAGFLRFALGSPSAFDSVSLRLLAVDALRPLLFAVLLWLAALGVGRRTLRLMRVEGLGPLDGIAAGALGLGLLGQAAFLLGWAGALRPAPLAALVLAAAALGAGELRRPAFAAGRPRAWAGAAAGLLAFAAFSAAMTALAPPAEWDVRAYHLALPELYLRAGRLVELPWMIHSHWPHLMETLYALPLAAGSDGAAALLHAGAAGLLVAGVFLAAREAGGASAAWPAALLLAGQPALLREAGTAHADAYTALCALAAAALLARWEREKKDGVLLAAGALAGLCAASKLTGLAALAGWTLWLVWRERRARPAALFAAAGLLMVGPWLLRSWLATGDPAWPLFSGALGLRPGAEFAGRYLRSNRWDIPSFSLLLHDGPLFLLAPLLGLFILSRRRPAPSQVERLLLLVSPAYLLIAFRHNEGWRFLMPVWAGLALAAGRAASAALGAKGARAVAALALVAAGAFPIAAATPNNELFAVTGARPGAAPDADRRAYWADRALGGLPGFYHDTASLLPPGAKVLLWREVRGYGAGFDYQWGDPMNQNLLDYRKIPDPDALFSRLRALGITHVLDNAGSTLYREDPGYYDARTLALMAECLRRHGRVALARGGFELHELL